MCDASWQGHLKSFLTTVLQYQRLLRERLRDNEAIVINLAELKPTLDIIIAAFVGVFLATLENLPPNLLFGFVTAVIAWFWIQRTLFAYAELRLKNSDTVSRGKIFRYFCPSIISLSFMYFMWFRYYSFNPRLVDIGIVFLADLLFRCLALLHVWWLRSPSGSTSTKSPADSTQT
jgi:hypothetical protein